MGKEAWMAAFSLVQGLWVTLKQMFSKTCTIQYPEQRLVWPERNRGRVVLPRDAKTGKDRCTACLMCQRICPNGSIEISTKVNEAGKRVLEDYVYHLERCTYCGLCVETCPFDALRMSHEHEVAARNTRELVRHLQQETLSFDPKWKGGLSAKADAGTQ